MKLFAPSCLFTMAMLALTHAAHAASVTQPQSVQVTSVSGSRSTTKGYFAFTTATSVAGCESGFWLPINDANYASHLARINDALVTKAPVVVTGDRDQLWAASTEKVCRITQLQ